MSNKVPAYIVKHAEALAKAHVAVKKHTEAIEAWVAKNGVDGMDFVIEHGLDNPYEYNVERTIETLQNL